MAARNEHTVARTALVQTLRIHFCTQAMCCPRPFLPTKTCSNCGRDFAWRKKWSRSWEDVRYCSDRCRKSPIREIDRRLERAILSLLAARPRNATVCPSEAAHDISPEGWRDLLEPARAAARRLHAQGNVDILQHGQRVDPSLARGPIRLRRRPTAV